MLVSIALILILGYLVSIIFNKLRLPGLIGMLLVGILLGPMVLNLIDYSILSISSELREIALIVILLRAGLSLDMGDLKAVGRPAILASFLPASMEIIAVMLIAPPLLGVSLIEAAIIGAMLAAVSPAVIVPKMINLLDNGYGKNKVPQLVMAGATVDDVYAIVLFTAFLRMYEGLSFDFIGLIKIPIAIISGLAVGILIGYILSIIFRRFHIRDTIKVVIALSLSFLLVGAEKAINAYVPYSALLSVMAIGMAILKFREVVAKRISLKFSKIWVIAEIGLFVLVGAAVDIYYVNVAGIATAILIFGALILRSAGVFISLIRTDFNLRERLFVNIAYIPKATVQAAVGGIPLAMGVASGNIILSIAVMSILITAPLGAILIDLTHKRLLK